MNIDCKLKRARESLVSKFLITSDSNQRAYKDLTTVELGLISEAIAVRLHLFNGEYPEFMPQAVRAVFEHPNLSKVDYEKLNTFTKMFELDWRGDQSIKNKDEFMATNPIYLNEKDQYNFNAYG